MDDSEQAEGRAGVGWIDAAWREDRAYLHAIASRILRDAADAEDVVSEAFARLAAQTEAAIGDTRGWLIVVVRRLALDRLRSAHARLSEPLDPTEPSLDLVLRDPVAPFAGATTETADPADRVTLDDEIRRALSVVVDRLTPGERAAFLLHDVFGVPFEDVGVLVGRSAAACRQLASRARDAIRAADPFPGARTPPHEPELDRVAERFAAACADGDVEGLATLLHDDVSGWAVRDGVQLQKVHGLDAVSAGVVAFFGPRSQWGLTPFPLDDAAAILVTWRDAPAGLIRLETDDEDLITQLRAVLLSESDA